MNTLEQIEVDITVELGSAIMPIHHLLRMGRRAIIELDDTPGVSTEEDLEEAQDSTRTTTGPLPGVGDRTTTSTTPTVPTTTSTTSTSTTTTSTTP